MSKQKYTFNDVKIGDTILTTNNEVGQVVAIKSYAYLNDKLLRKSEGNQMINELIPFQYDNVRHKGIWYSALTIAVLDKNVKNKVSYYLEGIDFVEIKDIVREDEDKKTFLNKIKQLLKWHS